MPTGLKWDAVAAVPLSMPPGETQVPRSEKTKAAQAIVNAASTALTLDLVEELAAPLAAVHLAATVSYR